MHLHSILRPELIKVPLEAEKKSEAISELVDLLVQHHEVPLSKRHAIVDEFAAQEYATRLEQGLAMTQLSTDRVEDYIVALGISAQGVQLGAADDQPTRIVILALSPKKGFEEDLAHLCGVKNLLEHNELVEQLAAATSGQEAWEILKAAEKK